MLYCLIHWLSDGGLRELQGPLWKKRKSVYCGFIDSANVIKVILTKITQNQEMFDNFHRYVNAVIGAHHV